MQTIEGLEKEYDKYELKSKFATNLEEFQAFIEIAMEDLDELTYATLKQIKLNNRAKLLTTIKNFFLSIIGEEIDDLYGEDNKILEELIDYTTSSKGIFERILEIADEDNFKELVRLVDFAMEHHDQQMLYYDAQRDALECFAQGITFYPGKYHDERGVFPMFMKKKLSQYNSTKSVEKVKKI